MFLSRCRVLAAALLALVSTAALGSARAATPKKVAAAGVGDVKLGMTYKALRARGLVGTIGPACELASPKIRSARLRSPLKGFVNLGETATRKVTGIFVTGATARGVGVGATGAEIERAFPKVVVLHSTEATFGFVLYDVPKRAGGKFAFRVDATTKKVTIIGIPNIPFCD